MQRILACLGVLALIVASAPIPDASGAGVLDSMQCTGDPAWFLGVVYDPEQRSDFIVDIDNFEFYLDTLRQTHCIEDDQAEILAMEDGFTCPDSANGASLPNCAGNSYEDGSEENLKDRIAEFGAAASEDPDAVFFFFLSSHGLMWTGALSPCSALRTTMSLSQLKGSEAEDGSLHDCELGDALNDHFDPHVRMFVAADCSFCGGFSDSLTAASGTAPDGGVQGTVTTSGIPGDNRIVVTGCAITTECFGSTGGGISYESLADVLKQGLQHCDGWSAPGFPDVQGANLPARTRPQDGECSASEWFWATVNEVYTLQQGLIASTVGIQQQYRIKYCIPTCPVAPPLSQVNFPSLDDDIRIL